MPNSDCSPAARARPLGLDGVAPDEAGSAGPGDRERAERHLLQGQHANPAAAAATGTFTHSIFYVFCCLLPSLICFLMNLFQFVFCLSLCRILIQVQHKWSRNILLINMLVRRWAQELQQHLVQNPKVRSVKNLPNLSLKLIDIKFDIEIIGTFFFSIFDQHLI